MRVCACGHTCPLLSGPGLAFLLVLHPQHQLPEEGAEGPGLREGTSSGRWWPWGGAPPCPSQAPREACMYQREQPLWGALGGDAQHGHALGSGLGTQWALAGIRVHAEAASRAPTFPELTAQKEGPDTNELVRGEGLGVHVPVRGTP